MFRLLFTLLLLCPAPLFADATRDRSAIVAAYEKIALALHLKFVDGVLASRAPGFKAYDADGERVDLSVETARYELLFGSALKLTANSDVTDFRALADGRAECKVRHEIVVTKYDAQKRKPYTVVIDSMTHDTWVRSAFGWRQEASRVLQQQYRPREMPSDR